MFGQALPQSDQPCRKLIIRGTDNERSVNLKEANSLGINKQDAVLLPESKGGCPANNYEILAMDRRSGSYRISDRLLYSLGLLS